MTCVLPGCSKPNKQGPESPCAMHYYRRRRTGSYDRTTPMQRFRALVAFAGQDECWLWKGPVLAPRNEYGHMKINRVRWLAHRYAYTIWVGDIPEGMTIDHVRSRGCRSTFCVNPRHLEVVTRAENSRRSNVYRGLEIEPPPEVWDGICRELGLGDAA